MLSSMSSMFNAAHTSLRHFTNVWKSGFGPCVRSWSNAPIVIKPKKFKFGHFCNMNSTSDGASSGRRPLLSV